MIPCHVAAAPNRKESDDLSKKVRVNCHISEKVAREIRILAEKYNVSSSYILQTGYKLCDRKALIGILELGVEG